MALSRDTFHKVMPIVFIFVVSWYFFAPGYMSSDSFLQYGSAMAGEYPDNHPAIMSYLWHYLMYIIPGPQSLLFFHLMLLALGIYFWQDNINSKFSSYILVLLFIMPWVINFVGVLWKDIGMAFSLLLGTSLLLNSRGNRKIALLSFPFILYAFAVRYNAILGIVPVVFMGIYYLFPRTSYLRCGMITCVIVVISFFCIKFFTYHIIHAEKKHYEILLMGDDIARISLDTNQEILLNVKKEDLQKCSSYPILYERALCFIDKGYDKNGILVVGMPVEDVHKLWLTTVIEHPLTYVNIKITAFLYFLRSPFMEPVTTWLPGINKNIYHLVVERPELVNKLETYVLGSQDTILSEFFKPYLWLLISLTLIPASLLVNSRTARLQIAALNLSSLGYFASLFLSVPSVDFRYCYWCIIAATVSIAIFTVELVSQKKNLVSRHHNQHII